MWGFLVALISGALMSIQGVFNTEMTKQTSLWVSTGWVQFSAFLVCVLAWIFTGRDSVGALWQGVFLHQTDQIIQLYRQLPAGKLQSA